MKLSPFDQSNLLCFYRDFIDNKLTFVNNENLIDIYKLLELNYVEELYPGEYSITKIGLSKAVELLLNN